MFFEDPGKKLKVGSKDKFFYSFRYFLHKIKLKSFVKRYSFKFWAKFNEFKAFIQIFYETN